MADRYGVRAADANRRRSKNEGGTTSIAAEKTDFDATERAKLSSVAGKGLGKGETGEGAPKQAPGEDIGSFGERMRQYRERERNKKKATMDQAGAALSKRLQ